MEGVNLTVADLRGANIQYALLNGVIIERVILDTGTVRKNYGQLISSIDVEMGNYIISLADALRRFKDVKSAREPTKRNVDIVTNILEKGYIVAQQIDRGEERKGGIEK